MKIVVVCDEAQKQELMAGGNLRDLEISWQKYPALSVNCDFYVDLLFSPDADRLNALSSFNSSVVVVNEIENSLKNYPENFVRINGWNSFLKNELIESSGPDNLHAATEKIFSFFNKKIEWVGDIIGFISPRIVSMIINEAYYALAENVSSKKEVDIAMKLGTNYPYGPFEWAEKIGLNRIYCLLKKLETENPRYKPCDLLEQEALSLQTS